MVNLKTNKDFQNMSYEKRQFVELLAQALEGKKLTEALPILVEWKKRMQQENITFTKEESQMLTTLLTENMTPQQKKQYDYLKHFIK